jgi:hypothetical protein
MPYRDKLAQKLVDNVSNVNGVLYDDKGGDLLI